MNKPHKHAEVIKAWADGAEVEFYYAFNDKWYDISLSPDWDEDTEYRVKPKKTTRFLVVRELSESTNRPNEYLPHKDIEKHFKIHEFVSEHETDWDNQRYEVLIDNNRNEYTAVNCLFSCRTLGTIRMSKRCAEKLCGKLNNGEIEL